MPTSRSRETPSRSELRRDWDVRALPRALTTFYLQALRTASQENDELSLSAAARPKEVAKLIELAHGRKEIVQVGTATAWTAIALALMDPRRRITSFDPVPDADRERYLALVAPDVRSRLLFLHPGETVETVVDLVVLDGSAETEKTVNDFTEWDWIVRPDGLVIIRHYRSSQHRGVAEAVSALGLRGSTEDGLFVWHKPPAPIEIGKRRAAGPSRVWRLAAILAALLVGVAAGLALGVATPLSDDDAKTVTATVVQTQAPPGRNTGTTPSTSGSKSNPPSKPKRKPRTRARNRSSKRASTSKRPRSSTAAKPSTPAKPRTSGRRLSFSGVGRQNLGTIQIRGTSEVSWTTRGRSFSIASDALRLHSKGHRGSTVVSKGRYRHFRIKTAGKWTLKVKPLAPPG